MLRDILLPDQAIVEADGSEPPRSAVPLSGAAPRQSGLQSHGGDERKIAEWIGTRPKLDEARRLN